jgi:hypothetical protein
MGSTAVYKREGATTSSPSTTQVVAFPFVIRDVRFLVGATWTAGWLVARAEGVFLLSEKDGEPDPVKLNTIELPPERIPRPIKSASVWIPIESIRKVSKSTTAGYTIEAGDGKFPLRLSVEERARFAALAAYLGQPF